MEPLTFEYMIDEANDLLLTPTFHIHDLPPPPSDDDLLAWLADMDGSTAEKSPEEKHATPTNDMNTASISSNSLPLPARDVGEQPTSPSSKKRDRAAHRRYERKRRAAINKRIRTLQELVPTSSMTDDKVTLLDKTIEHIKQLHEITDVSPGIWHATTHVISQTDTDNSANWGMPVMGYPVVMVPATRELMAHGSNRWGFTSNAFFGFVSCLQQGAKNKREVYVHQHM